MHRLLPRDLKSSPLWARRRCSLQTSTKNGSHVANETTGRPAIPLELEKFLPYRLEVLSSLVSRALESLYARHGLTVGEWFVLMTLGQGGEMTARTLGVKNQMQKTRVSTFWPSRLNRGL